MNKLIRLGIKNISYHLIWVMTLLEAITVTILAILSHYRHGDQQLKSIWNGFLVAFIGTYLTMLILNKYIEKLNFRLNDDLVLKVAPVTVLSFWSGLLLAILFYIQELIVHLNLTTKFVINLMLAGFISTALSSIIVYYIYKIITMIFYPLRIIVHTQHSTFEFIGLAITSLAILVGLYELIALPIINIWQSFPLFLQIPAGFLTGALGGSIGSIAVILLYRLAPEKFKIFFLFSKKTSFSITNDADAS